MRVIAEKERLVILKCIQATRRYRVLWPVRRRVSAIGCVPACNSLQPLPEYAIRSIGGSWLWSELCGSALGAEGERSKNQDKEKIFHGFSAREKLNLIKI